MGIFGSLLDPSTNLALINKKLFDQLGPSGSGDFSEDTKYRTELQNQINNSNLPEEVKKTASELPSSWEINSSQTEKKKGYTPAEVNSFDRNYSRVNKNDAWAKNQDFVRNRIGEWVDNVTSTYTPENIAKTTVDTFAPLANPEAIQDATPVVSQLRQAERNKEERKNFENRLDDYEYLNELVEDDDDDPTYNGLTYADAIDQIAQGMIGNPERKLTDREKDIISNRSDSWGNKWSLPYVAASDKAYRKAYNDRATSDLGDDAALLKEQTFDYNFGPVSFGPQDKNAMDSNTNYGFYIDPDSPAKASGEFNYQPYNNADDDTWDYAFGTGDSWGKNYLGEMANNVNNFFNGTANVRRDAAEKNAAGQPDTVVLNDGNEVSVEDLKKNTGFNGNFYDPSAVTSEEAEALKEAGAQELGDRDSSQMTPTYSVLIGKDGTILPGDFDFDRVQFSPDSSEFYVTGYGPFDGTYSVDSWLTANKVYATADDLGLSDEDRADIVGNAPVIYYQAEADPNDEDSIRNNVQDFTMPDGQIVTADDLIKYLNNENVVRKDQGPLNIFKEDVDLPWKDGLNLQTWAENLAPWFVDTGLGSWQTLVPVVSRLLGPLWGGARAIADVQGLNPNNDNLRGDLSGGGGYTKSQQYLRALGDLADPLIERAGGIGGRKNPMTKLENATGKYAGPVAKGALKTANEGFEEVLTSAIQQLGTNPYASDWGHEQEYDPKTKQYVISDENTGAQELRDNFIGGALFSLPINTATTAVDYAKNKDSYKEKRDTPFHPRRTKYDKTLDYNLDDDWKNYYDQYKAGE